MGKAMKPSGALGTGGVYSCAGGGEYIIWPLNVYAARPGLLVLYLSVYA